MAKCPCNGFSGSEKPSQDTYAIGSENEIRNRPDGGLPCFITGYEGQSLGVDMCIHVTYI